MSPQVAKERDFSTLAKAFASAEMFANENLLNISYAKRKQPSSSVFMQYLHLHLSLRILYLCPLAQKKHKVLSPYGIEIYVSL